MELDENGWVNIDQLLMALREENSWSNLTQEDLVAMVRSSDKKRHEVLSGKIRALYGHSLQERIVIETNEPTEVLYHGTARRFFESIKEKGLLPRGRQYVHLSTAIETAYQVGRRRDNEPIILLINSKQAWDEGIKFYQGNDIVWLADVIPSKYIYKLDVKM